MSEALNAELMHRGKKITIEWFSPTLEHYDLAIAMMKDKGLPYEDYSQVMLWVARVIIHKINGVEYKTGVPWWATVSLDESLLMISHIAEWMNKQSEATKN